MNTNKILLTGNLVGDPELSPAGQSKVCRFTIACNEGFGGKEYTSFLDCEAWGKVAEHISSYCKKGGKILIVGSLKQDRWEKDGKKHSRVIIKITEYPEFLFDTKPSLSPFSKGDKVYVNKRGYGPTYPGTIVKCGKDTVEVEFEDEKRETFNWSEIIINNRE